jgi:hypothetical protein
MVVVGGRVLVMGSSAVEQARRLRNGKCLVAEVAKARKREKKNVNG